MKIIITTQLSLDVTKDKEYEVIESCCSDKGNWFHKILSDNNEILYIFDAFTKEIE